MRRDPIFHETPHQIDLRLCRHQLAQQIEHAVAVGASGIDCLEIDVKHASRLSRMRVNDKIGRLFCGSPELLVAFLKLHRVFFHEFTKCFGDFHRRHDTAPLCLAGLRFKGPRLCPPDPKR